MNAATKRADSAQPCTNVVRQPVHDARHISRPKPSAQNQPLSFDQVSAAFEIQRLLHEASNLERQSGKASPLWGRVGELCTALVFGVRLSRRYAQGHDGRLGNELVEVKTIGPLKRKLFVRAKRAGNFSLLAVIRVYADQTFEAIMLPRDRLPRGNCGVYVTLRWKKACALAEVIWRAQLSATPRLLVSPTKTLL